MMMININDSVCIQQFYLDDNIRLWFEDFYTELSVKEAKKLRKALKQFIKEKEGV